MLAKSNINNIEKESTEFPILNFEEYTTILFTFVGKLIIYFQNFLHLFGKYNFGNKSKWTSKLIYGMDWVSPQLY